MAWLRTPYGKSEKSRYQLMVETKADLGLPEKGCLGYLIEYLESMGFHRSLVPNNWRDIGDWASLMRLNLNPAEVDAMHKLSAAYVAEVNRSAGVDNQAPTYTPPPASAVEGKLRSFFSAIRGQKK